MKFNVLITAALLLSTTQASATYYKTSEHAPKEQQVWPIPITPVEILGLSVFHDPTGVQLHVHQYKRVEADFSYLGVKSKTPIVDLAIDGDGDIYTVFGTHYGKDQWYGLVGRCGADRLCTPTLITFSMAGNFIKKTATTLTPCSSFYVKSGLIYSSCEQSVLLDSSGVMSSMASTRSIDDAVVKHGKVTILRHEENRMYLDYGASSIALPIEGDSLPLCRMSDDKSPLLTVRCFIKEPSPEGKPDLYIYRSEIFEVDLTESQIRSSSKLEWETELSSPLKFFSIHRDKDNLFTRVTDENSGHIENTTLTGKRYTYRTYPVANNEIDVGWLREPNSYFVMTADRVSEGLNKFSFYDHIPEKSLPSLSQGNTPVAWSGKPYTSALVVQDEETLTKDVDVSLVNAPSFLSWDHLIQSLTGAPTHVQVGKYEFEIVLKNKNGENAIPLSLEVRLSPYQVKVFEPSIFPSLGLKEPVDLFQFSSAVNQLSVVEDKNLQFDFTIDGRLQSELSITVSHTGVPWLSLRENVMGVSGTPLQEHVGKGEFLIHVVDLYETKPVEPAVLHFDVIEVNDIFSITSDAPTSINAGELYTYHLKIDDEETAQSDMMINAALIPEWLEWDEKTHVLSGVAPSNSGEESYRVQFIVQEKGFHSVLHQFSIRVEQEAKESSGGAGGALWLMLLMSLMIARRK